MPETTKAAISMPSRFRNPSRPIAGPLGGSETALEATVRIITRERLHVKQIFLTAGGADRPGSGIRLGRGAWNEWPGREDCAGDGRVAWDWASGCGGAGAC